MMSLAVALDRLAQKDRDLREAVQALHDRAKDAFDCGFNLSDEALEEAWEIEAPADYEQYKRLQAGAET